MMRAAFRHTTRMNGGREALEMRARSRFLWLGCFVALLAVGGLCGLGCDEAIKQPPLETWLVIEGSVADSASSAPLPGSQVAYFPTPGQRSSTVTADSVGAYHFTIMGVELRGAVEASAENHASRTYDLATATEPIGTMRYRLNAFLPRAD
jgi:hypothetical protein